MLRTRILEAGVVCTLLASPLSAQENFAPATDVEFKISADTSGWPAGESRTLRYRLTTSVKQLYSCRENGNSPA